MKARFKIIPFMIIKCSFNKKHSLDNLCLQSKKIALEPNAGGNSVLSEVYSFEVLKRTFNAVLIKSELEIEYSPYCSKKTDYMCQINGIIYGISVTRAMKFNAEFTQSDAKELLEKKLIGIKESTKNQVIRFGEFGWSKQILHIWTSNHKISELIREEFINISSDIKGDTILLITISLKGGEFIFKSNYY